MIYAIADLHLGFGINKPMDKFGEDWIDHAEKIKVNWLSTVKNEDTVLVVGDISWAMHLKDAMPDFEWLDSLTGKKIVYPGNHDYWWETSKKLNALPLNTITFIKHGFVVVEGIPICGSRGWFCPGDIPMSAEDDKVYKRELQRVESALKQAVLAGCNEGIVLALHYPPTNIKLESSGFTDLIDLYGVNKVIFGHLHDDNQARLKGWVNGAEYQLISSNIIGFCPVRISEI
jgi:predicted phosphohydrolase